jgi:SAM-dependent methyltransferase
MPLLNDLLRQFKLDHLLFTLAYRRGMTPWDTGIAPPELVKIIEGPSPLPPGRALDLGCGTGTNSLYLARHGWHVTGIDFAAPAIAHARAKAQAAGTLPGSMRFLRGDVTNLDALPLDGPYTLLFDQGCLHGIPSARRRRYADGLACHAVPGALYLLYAFGPRQIGVRTLGLTPDEVRHLFLGAFTIEHLQEGSDTGRAFTAAWYWLRRTP